MRNWFMAIQKPDLIGICYNVPKKRSQYRVCDIHFAEHDKFEKLNKKSNLKANAIPTLYVSGKFIAHAYIFFNFMIDIHIFYNI